MRRLLPDVSDPAKELRVAGKTPPAPSPTLSHPSRQEGLRQREVFCSCAAVARERAANPRARSQAGAARLSLLASLTYNDLAVGRRAQEGCLLFFHFGRLAECTLGLQVWTRGSQ